MIRSGMDNSPNPDVEDDLFAEFRELPETEEITKVDHKFSTDAQGRPVVTFPATAEELSDTSKEEQLLQSQHNEAGVFIPHKPKGADTPVNQGIMDDITRAKENLERDTFVQNMESVGDVEVTIEERARFLRCALHDEEMWYDVIVPAFDTTIRVAIPTEQYTAWAIGALHVWGKTGIIDPESGIQWLLAFQQVHAFFQVREIGGIPVAWAEDAARLTTTSAKAVREFLADDEGINPIFRMSDVRWKMCIRAMRVAEVKNKICVDALSNRDFFAIAGTD